MEKTKRNVNLVGQKFGLLTVLRKSDKRGSRGARTVPLWECACDCGKITYKSTDVLRNKRVSSCAECAHFYAIKKMHEKAGFVGGTQVTRIVSQKTSKNNTSGERGVYYVEETGKWRARIRFKGKLINLGTFSTLQDASKARRRAEDEYFGEFLRSLPDSENPKD